MTKQEFADLSREGVILLDGATGSNLMKAGMPKGVCTEQWIVAHEEVLIDLQRGYYEAGSQIVYAPTFAANAISLGEHGLEEEVEELNYKLVDISRRAVGKQCYIAGDITTTGKMDLSYEELFALYQQQICCLKDAGVDLLVAETMVGVTETMAAIDAAQSVCELPILCSMTIESDGSLFFGGNVFEAAVSFQDMGVSAVGINCSTGPEQLEAVVTQLKKVVSIPIIVKPNAGMPTIDEAGNAVYSMTPREFAASMQRLIALGADIVGGCCGTTPAFIQELNKLK